MISLGGSSAYLQNQVISGFDSVAQGFNANAPMATATGLQTALDSFSSFDTNEMTELAGMSSQQLMSGAGEFSSPATYLQNQRLAPDDEVLRAFQDPSLGSGGDLSSISEILSRIIADATTKLEQAGLITPPQIGGSTELDQVGLITPPQIGGSTKLEQAGLITPPQVGGFTELDQVGLITPPQVGGSTKLEQAGLITPPQVGGSAGPTEPFAPSQFGAFDEITFSPQQTTALASMSKTVREAASLFQNLNVSMLGRNIVG